MTSSLVLETIASGLDEILLPPMVRPNINQDSPNEELVVWGTRVYSYSLIAHSRNLLATILKLASASNVVACYIVGRHLFEVTAQACYVSRNLGGFKRKGEWSRAMRLLTVVATGNLWFKQHGSKHDDEKLLERVGGDIPPLSIANVFGAYEAYRAGAKDDYGFLSEHAHPNAACFVQYHNHAMRNGIPTLEFINASGPIPLSFLANGAVDILHFLDLLFDVGEVSSMRGAIRDIQLKLASLVGGGT